MSAASSFTRPVPPVPSASDPAGEAAMTAGRMIDADGHVIEQLELGAEVRDAFFLRLNGELPIRIFSPADDPIPDEASHAELMYRPGGSEPGPRLADMDLDGIDIAVL